MKDFEFHSRKKRYNLEKKQNGHAQWGVEPKVKKQKTTRVTVQDVRFILTFKDIYAYDLFWRCPASIAIFSLTANVKLVKLQPFLEDVAVLSNFFHHANMALTAALLALVPLSGVENEVQSEQCIVSDSCNAC